MSVSFKKAEKQQRMLRMALMGPSGSGKTLTSLLLAKELAEGGTIALLDTERGSASLYSDRVEFDTCQLENFKPQTYIEAIKMASEAGYKVLVIDSLSHAWSGEGGLLDQVSARGGNSFTDGWGKVGTPLQNQLLKAILECPMHVIVTMRVKTEYVVEKDERGKSVPKRVGLTAVQREGVEYEFDIIGLLDLQNTLTIEKTRMMALTGEVISKPDGALARKIMGWLSDGVPPPTPDEEHAFLNNEIATTRDALKRTDGNLTDYARKKYSITGAWTELNLPDKKELLGMLQRKVREELGAGV
jgi:hypothetical protein